MQSYLHVAGNTQNCFGETAVKTSKKNRITSCSCNWTYLYAAYFSAALIMILTKVC